MSQENVEIVRGLHESFANGDNESPFAVYDPAIEWDMSRAPLPGEESVFHGHEGVRAYWRAWLAAWEFVDAPIERLVDAEDQVVSLFGQSKLRGKVSGVDVEMAPWAQVWTLRNRAVVRMRIYPEHAGALEAVGLRE